MKKSIVTTACILVPVLALVILGFSLVGLSQTVGEIRTEISRSEADVILASADIGNDTVVSVPIIYYDQVMDDCVNMYDDFKQMTERQFEWTTCGYYNENFETGIIDSLLDSEFLPIAANGEKTTNRGISKESFKRWFHNIEGKSQSYAGNLNLKYDASDISFKYESDEFYPLTKIGGTNDIVNRDGENHLFTLNLGVPFQVLADGNEEFSIYADDDTWVFLDDQMVIDMGGIHDGMTGRFKIVNNGEVYSAINNEEYAYTGVKLSAETGTIVRVFHADRDSRSSVFHISFKNMLLNTAKNPVLARKDDPERIVAYNPEEPSYVAPLGESLTVRPNSSEAMVTAAIAQVTVIIMMIILFAITTSVALQYSRRDRIQGE